MPYSTMLAPSAFKAPFAPLIKVEMADISLYVTFIRLSDTGAPGSFSPLLCCKMRVHELPLENLWS